MSLVDGIIYGGVLILAVAFVVIVRNYAKGLGDSPRELWVIFTAKIMEYIAYGAMNMAFVLYLSKDVGLTDMEAGSFIGFWSTALTMVTMFVGAIADSMGIKKVLIMGTLFLLFARLIMPFTSDLTITTLFGFLPLAFGMAMMGPVISVGIKKFTTKETSALGFGLFYTLMNVGWAGGGWLFDYVRLGVGENGVFAFGRFQLSAYQTIFLASLFFTIINLIILLFMRDGVVFEGGVVRLQAASPVAKRDTAGSGATAILATTFSPLFSSMTKGAKDSWVIMKSVAKESAFWRYLFILGVFVFVKMVFYHMHYTFPKYGIRVLGDEVKVGSIFGVLNPVMIVFLTPMIAFLTARFSSYRVLLIGTIVSASSIFIVALPDRFFSGMQNTWFSQLIFERWLNVSPEHQSNVILSLVIMTAIYTIGEAIWSPRLMQFSAEIAPPGKEGSYISLSALPYFVAKLGAGPLSGWLLSRYVPEGLEQYPDHYMVWVWVGAIAVLSPLGMFAFRGWFRKAELAQHQIKHDEQSGFVGVVEQET